MKKRLWIPILGWILCYGFLHNCLIAPITGLSVVDWEYLLTAMGILLGVSGVRDIGLKERKNRMWYQITNLLNKGKYWIIAGAVAVLYILGYRCGKEKEQVKVMKGTVDNVKTAKRSRDSLANPERVKRLHNKYKR